MGVNAIFSKFHARPALCGNVTSAALANPARSGVHPNSRTIADIAGFGGRCLVVEPEGARTKPSIGLLALALPNVADGLLPILEIIPIQLLMVPMAIARGFEPARFRNGSKVTIIA
jgi:glucosamine 6-phosphate synthetase-like amidotransferase/phosphosugar isomerase protein